MDVQIHLLTSHNCWGSSYPSSHRRHSSRHGDSSGGDGNDGGTTGTSGTFWQTVELKIKLVDH